jgi:hypothetical protein
MFDPTRGAPYLRSVEVRINGNGGSALRIGTDYFAAAAGRASSQLVGEEVLREGETIRYTVLAYPLPDQDAPPAGSIDVTLAAPALTLSASAFPEGRRRGALGDAGDLPVVLPVSLLDETAALAIADRPRETGGILIGHLARDPGDGKLFARVTAQVPAQHAEATSTRLTFAPATWTRVAAAVQLRRRDEVMLGWWHSHPVREWCAGCAEERRRSCAFAAGFLSAHDRSLHRTVFPRAWSVALVVNDVGFGPGPTHTLFGWRAGLLVERGFDLVDEEDTVCPT